jgi:hypothetical protein
MKFCSAFETTENATATATADPFGMTTKKTNATADPCGMTTKNTSQS